MKHVIAPLFALLCAVIAPVSALAEEAALPAPLQALLAAAAADPDPARFTAAVELMALTQSPDAIAAGAALVSDDHAGTARDTLGMEPVVMAETAPAGPAPEAEPQPIWKALPAQAVSTLAMGESDLWTGQVRAGFRQDSGNSDRVDYTLALSVERDLAVWGFEAGVNYAYAESDGAVGADALIANAQLDRETGERWSVFIGGQYEQDNLSGFDYTGVLDLGLAYRVLTGEVRTLTVQAGPAARFIHPINGDLRMEPASEFSADFDWQISDTLSFAADSELLVTDQSRFEQILALQTSLGELWALQLAYRYRNEFDPEPGFEEVDTRSDISIVREF